MAISRLATSNPASSTDVLIYTGTRTILGSVIATNKSATSSNIKVWIVPLDQDSSPENHVYISYDVSVASHDSLETFRFPIVNGDKVYVRSSGSDMSFMLSGIDDANVTGMEYAALEALILGLA